MVREVHTVNTTCRCLVLGTYRQVEKARDMSWAGAHKILGENLTQAEEDAPHQPLIAAATY